MPLVSSFVKDALVGQMAEEKRNANIYLTIAGYLKSKGLDNIAKMFETQHAEENEHSLMIYNLLVDLGEQFDMPDVIGFNTNAINSLLDIAQLYLDKEIETTNSLKEIREASASESEGGCPVVEVRMIEMIKLQQNEFEEATSFWDKCQIIGDDWKTALLWDASLGGK